MGITQTKETTMSIKNNRVYIAVGMFCGTDDSDLLVPEVYESREDARKAIIEAILGAAASAELMDEERHLVKDEFGNDGRVDVTVQGMVDGKNVLDDSLTVLTDEEIDRVVPADVRKITLKDYSYDEYWTWEIHEKVIG
jgi:hypothetical protein